ncbi:MAG TPA: HEAT repeat domain-containing protein, partial [Candidatus Marinimicrobia bacterium]|nr:HEAT repeat domain-containing protein [Candidatus Neomarinimicrobiota bacterium]
MRRKSIICGIFLFALSQLFAEVRIIQPVLKKPCHFAIIIDTESFQKIEKAVLAYRDAVEADGLSTFIYINNWSNPMEVRNTIIELKQSTPTLEGVVFVGDIPIAMLRDAQHMASAFKMDQERYPFVRSSIPSDRFYDDFDLQFNFIEQDTSNPLLYYYSLVCDSPQKVEREIYSGRIKAPLAGDEKYDVLEKYLFRVAAQKREINRLDNMLRFTGHGYNSEALSAWEGESLSLREQFPHLHEPGGSLISLYHEMSPEMKTRLINELEQDELDFALFHAHGGVEAQYLIGYPGAGSINQNVDAIKLFVRNKLREARRRKKPVDSAKEYYMAQHGIPEAWFEGAFEDSVIYADSLYSAKLDMDVTDVALFKPGAEIIIFDQCFNGAFIRTPYMAGAYVFGDGSTVAGIANSVNVKQDVWADEGLGLLNYNIRIGQWHRERNYLENHIIGDPTFRFTNPDRKDWGRIIARQDHKIRFWEKLLKSDEIPLKSLAVRKLYQLKKTAVEPQLITIYENDPSYIVRLSALKCLADLRSKPFEEILFKSVNDPYELIRRFTVNWMGVVGREDYLPVLVEAAISDPSKRVSYTAKSAIEKIGYDKANLYFREEIKNFPDVMANRELLQRFERSSQRSVEWLREELIPKLTSDTLLIKKRIGPARTFRNYQFQEALPVLIERAVDIQ